jgi:hypothetical protein
LDTLPAAPSTTLTYKSIFNFNEWQRLLHRHPDKSLTTTLLDGLINGVHVEYHGDRTITRTISPNLPSTIGHENFINNTIAIGLAAGRVAGPFLAPPFHNFISSPLGIVPKKHSINKYRLIHDLSWPRIKIDGKKVITGVNAEVYGFDTVISVFDDAASMVVACGRGCWLTKLDIKSAYRHIPIHIDDHHLLGFTWNNQYYYDKALPFGLSSSVFKWEQYATAIEWMARDHHPLLQLLVHYVDDYLLVNKGRRTIALMAVSFIIKLFITLKIPLALNKLLTALQKLEYLGIIINTLEMTASLSNERLTTIRSTLLDWLNRKSCTPRELDSLIGTLSFAARVVRPGRIFLRRLINLHTATLELPRITLSKDACDDIKWWYDHIFAWNGIGLLYEQSWSSNTDMQLHVTTDASSNYGAGGIYRKQWFTHPWTNEDRIAAISDQITGFVSVPYLELKALTIAAATWGHHWGGKRIMFHTDCEPVVAAVNNMSAKSNNLMTLIRAMAHIAARHNFEYRLTHIPGTTNILADCLSRGQVDQFTANKAAKFMEPLPTTPILPQS